MNSVVHEFLQKEFPSGCTLNWFAKQQGLDSPISDPVIRRLCDTVVMSRPFHLLVPLLDMLSCHVSGFSSLFSRLPEHVKVRVVSLCMYYFSLFKTYFLLVCRHHCQMV
jgi:hypothetical protein